ncbi:MAG TPA: zf-HC2 domain-containing protein [Elusimicrobiales bacterium]|nr:zf-HC2 domain-containing protein [Elusimicrobiales bacterium]
MACRYDIEAYHDGELPPRELLLLKEHLSNCKYCAGKLAELRALDRLLAPPSETTSRDISAAVLAALPLAADTELRRRPWLGWWKVPALVMASCALFVLGIETGLFPSSTRALASALAAQSETHKLSSLLFGRGTSDDEELLAAVFDCGEEK